MGKKNSNKLAEMFEKLLGIERRVVEKILRRDDTERRISKPIESRFSEQVSGPNCESDRSYRCVRMDGLQNYDYQKFEEIRNALTLIRVPQACIHKKVEWLGFLQRTGKLRTTLHQLIVRLNMNESSIQKGRHRFLEWLCNDLEKKSLRIAEASEAYFLDLLKGGAVLKFRIRKPHSGTSTVWRRFSKEQLCVFMGYERFGYVAGTKTRFGNISPGCCVCAPYCIKNINSC